MSHDAETHPGQHAKPAHETEPVTTTHAEPGSGHPQLVVVVAPLGQDAGLPGRFPLDKDEVTIGSGPDQDIRLPGTDPHHVTVYHDERDEYRLRPVGPVGGGSSAEPADRALRTGASIRLGEWELTFHREEFADHGRPFGGRQGGEGSVNKLQPPREADQGDERVESAQAGEEQVEDQRPLPERQQ